MDSTIIENVLPINISNEQSPDNSNVPNTTIIQTNESPQIQTSEKVENQDQDDSLIRIPSSKGLKKLLL